MRVGVLGAKGKVGSTMVAAVQAAEDSGHVVGEVIAAVYARAQQIQLGQAWACLPVMICSANKPTGHRVVRQSF